MPGPNSSPCGDRSIVENPHRRQELRDQGKLFTGKTQLASQRGPRFKAVPEAAPKGKKR